MKCYIGKINIKGKDSNSVTDELFGLVIGSMIYWSHDTCTGIGIYHLDSSNASVNIPLNEDGEPSFGEFVDEAEAMDVFLKSVKLLKQKLIPKK